MDPQFITSLRGGHGCCTPLVASLNFAEGAFDPLRIVACPRKKVGSFGHLDSETIPRSRCPSGQTETSQPTPGRSRRRRGGRLAACAPLRVERARLPPRRGLLHVLPPHRHGLLRVHPLLRGGCSEPCASAASGACAASPTKDPRIAKSSSSLVRSSSEGSSSGSSFSVCRSCRHLHTSFSASSVRILSVT